MLWALQLFLQNAAGFELHHDCHSKKVWSSPALHSDLIQSLITDLGKGSEQLEYLRGTIDFHRRHVSQFYGFLTSVYDEGGMQRKWIYTHWSRSDLQILPDVIVPMEQALGAVIGNPASPTTLDRLLRLYNDSPHLPVGKL